MDTLALTIRPRLETQPSGARINADMTGNRRTRTAVDFIVNGQSLGDLFEIDQRDLVGMLDPGLFPDSGMLPDDPLGPFAEGRNRLQELTLRVPAYYEQRRMHIYGCPECGDLECGNVTVQVIEKPNSVIWRAFDNHSPAIAAYISPDKYRTSNKVFEIWRDNQHSYAFLDEYARHPSEDDFVFLSEFRAMEETFDYFSDRDLKPVVATEIAYPHIGPFEFDKVAYLQAFKDFRAS